ncbi:MAG: TetR/AcrR family transcriptional regulator [Pseudomonadota bacterium]
MPRTNLSAAETRTLILDRAEHLFRTQGYERTTIGDIAADCGFSPSNVHKHFGTKAAVNEAIADRMLRYKEEAALIAVRKETTAAGKLRAFLMSIFATTQEFLLKEKRVHDMVLAAIDNDWSPVRAYRRRLLAIITEIVEEGVASGEFADANPERSGRIVSAACAKLLHPIMVADAKVYDEDGVEADLIDFVIGALKRG